MDISVYKTFTKMSAIETTYQVIHGMNNYKNDFIKYSKNIKSKELSLDAAVRNYLQAQIHQN